MALTLSVSKKITVPGFWPTWAAIEAAVFGRPKTATVLPLCPSSLYLGPTEAPTLWVKMSLFPIFMLVEELFVTKSLFPYFPVCYSLLRGKHLMKSAGM